MKRKTDRRQRLEKTPIFEVNNKISFIHLIVNNIRLFLRY